MRGVFRIAFAEYLRWLVNPRIVILLILFIYARESVGVVLCEHADIMKTQLHCFEPYLALNNSVVATLIMPAFFLVLMSDFPVMEGSYLWSIYRTGKLKWILVQMLFAEFAILTMIFGMFLSALFSCWENITMKDGWSDVVTRYYLVVPEDAKSEVAQLIQGDVYNHLSVGHAMFLSITLTSFMLLCYCAILLCGKIYGRKYLALSICVALMGVGVALDWMESYYVFLFPSAHGILSGHNHEYLREPIMPYWASYLYFLIMILVVIGVSVYGIKRRAVCKNL